MLPMKLIVKAAGTASDVEEFMTLASATAVVHPPNMPVID